MLLEGIYSRLSTDAAITALGAQVFPSLAEKEAVLPYLVYTQVGASQVNSFDGVNRLQSARLRFSCYGTSYASAKALCGAVKASLSGLLATLSDGTQVQGCWLADLQGTIFASHVDYSLNFVDNA